MLGFERFVWKIYPYKLADFNDFLGQFGFFVVQKGIQFDEHSFKQILGWMGYVRWENHVVSIGFMVAALKDREKTGFWDHRFAHGADRRNFTHGVSCVCFSFSKSSCECLDPKHSL